MATRHRVIVLGAGWAGIAAAKAYLAINASESLLVVESGSSVGGVWSRARIYPNLVVNAPLGYFEFSDMSMADLVGAKVNDDCKAEMVAEYLETYAKQFGVLDKCRFNTEAVKIEKTGDGREWKISVRPTGNTTNELEELTCVKLIVATGTDSTPKVPTNLETDSFSGAIFHAKEFGQRFKEILQDDVQNVVVVGGNKSSWEIAGLCALAGKEVNWLIREDGAGPGLMIRDRPDGKTPNTKIMSRMPGMMAPTLYHSKRWITRFLYGGTNWFGRWFSVWFWKKLLKKSFEDYEHPNRQILLPYTDSFFWISAGLSIFHAHDDAIFKLVDEGKLLKISRAKITSMSNRTLEISDGRTINADVVIFATGWDLPYSTLFDPALALDLGLPVPIDSQPAPYRQHWDDLDKAAKDEVLKSYPILQNPPAKLGLDQRPPPSTTPLRHLRGVVPTTLSARNDRSIVFLGNIISGALPTVAEVTALWSIAYMEDKIPANSPLSQLFSNKEAMEKEVAAWNGYFKTRYVIQSKATLAMAEAREVLDRMLADLGVRPDRIRMKTGSSVKEYTQPYMPQDYRGITEEFLEVLNKGKRN